ncbi:MAG: hypothetical protein RL115_112 [Bacteroidota bacterium]|jgi:hypothetical protein
MKILISLTFIAIIISCQTGKSAKIILQKADSLADTVIAGQNKTILYKINNTGNINLVIKDFTLSCECTATDITKGNEILPSSEKIVTFVMNTQPSEKGKTKVLLCTFVCNTNPQINTIKIPVYIK